MPLICSRMPDLQWGSPIRNSDRLFPQTSGSSSESPVTPADSRAAFNEVDAETIQDVAELAERFGRRPSLRHTSQVVGDDRRQEFECAREHMRAFSETTHAIPFRLRQSLRTRLRQPIPELRLVVASPVRFRGFEPPPHARKGPRW